MAAFALSGAAGAGADALTEMLKQKFLEQITRQKLAEDQRQADMRMAVEQRQLGQGDRRLAQEDRAFDASQMPKPAPPPKPLFRVQGGVPTQIGEMPANGQLLPDAPAGPKGPSSLEAALTEAYASGDQAKIAGVLRVMKQQADATRAPQQAGGNLTPEGLALAAGMLAGGGGMIPLGMGASGTRIGIINEAAKLTDPASLAGKTASFQANKGSLVQLQRNRDSIKSFEQTAQKNIAVLEGTMQRLSDSGSPLLNRPIREWQRAAAGDPTLSAFDAARRIVVNEVAKITSNPSLGGVLTDEARREADKLLTGEQTIPQMMASLQILRQDMGNRIGSFDTQIQEIQGRFGGSPAAKETPEARLKRLLGK